MRRVFAGAALVAVLGALAGGVALSGGTITGQAATNQPAVEKKIQGTGTPAPWPCPANFVQKFDPNRNGNFASDGTKNPDEEFALMGRDARYLAFRANDLGLAPFTDPASLLTPGRYVEGKSCLSQEGQAAWNQVKGALSGKGVTVDTNAQVPANYYNTGMANGRPVVDSQPGIGGDRSATKYVLRDGSIHYVMHRCGNLGLPSQGNLPKGPTDHQRPPSPPAVPPRERECGRACATTTSPPPPVCPPDMPHGTPPICKDGPERGTTNGNGLGRNTDPGPGIYVPPAQMEQSPATPRVNPAPPAAPTPTPPPKVTPSPTPAPQPVDPGTQPPNNGTVDPNPGSGQPCNPDFQNCG